MKSFSLLQLLAFVSCAQLAITNVGATPTTNTLPRNCNDIQARAGRDYVASGIYTIHPTNTKGEAAQVFCDMETSEGGWLVIQRRRETDEVPQLDFFRHWADYVDGFGPLQGSHWLGLDMISTLTNTDRYKLRIDMMDWEGEERFAEYACFQVSNSSDNFRLTVNSYSGNAGDSLTYHDQMQFSTKDRDNDVDSGRHCAELTKGGWWHKSCYYSNLNGVYGSLEYHAGTNWATWHGWDYSLKRVEMKIQSIK